MSSSMPRTTPGAGEQLGELQRVQARAERVDQGAVGR